ncbi:hypothetical protein KGY79_07845, partial [Candidatus Bipolaricaulota bacterium]|nr:hypothetical protein [Candidatus Bipolaricaulota bacterium]
AFGRSEISEVKRPVNDLLDPRIDFKQEKAINMDPDDKKVQLEDGKEQHYDYLVLSTGSKLDMGGVLGLKEAGHHQGILKLKNVAYR